MYENDRLKRDYSFFLGVAALLFVLGAVFVYSASSLPAYERLGNAAYFLYRHCFVLMLGIGLAVLCTYIPIGILQAHAPAIFGSTLLVTALTLLNSWGVLLQGMQRWLMLGPHLCMPSEFLKVTLCLYVGHVLAKNQRWRLSWGRGYFPLLMIVGLAVLVVVQQGDVGTAVLMGTVFLLVAFVADSRTSHLLVSLSMVVPVLGYMMWRYPEGLQRFLLFFNPWHDTKDAGVALVQSLIAIGTGSWWGAGVAYSKQKFLQLPLQYSDGIFAIIAEEVGFLGCLVILSLYAAFLFFGVRIARQLSDPFAAYVTLGAVFFIAVQALLNVLTITGMLPLYGVGLPFMGYNVSSVLGTCLMLGLISSAVRDELLNRAPGTERWV